jgi:hypothetical protein
MRRISTWDRPKLISRPRGGLGLAGRPQVVPALRELHVAQRGDNLAFDDDLVLDDQVGGIFADDHVVAKDHDSPLLDDAEPRLSRLVGKGVLVDLFNEPMTERIGDPERSADDPPSHRPQQPRIPFIHLHPAHPP